ncbi:MAG: right-handed parallel beta-helix repeat-containing protein [Planctomycetes bacterium]|nr:right-handed parallel beta-helix repeat-containing protein [Planctomycetota bacterium]
MRSLLACCPFAVAAVALPAQATHLVGPGGFAQIRDALAVAAAGDRIHVQPGTYAHFTATIGCTIRALVPGSVSVAYDVAFQPPGCTTNPGCWSVEGPTRLSPPAGQTIDVVGLRFVGNESPGGFLYPIRHRVAVESGRVTFDQCNLQASNTAALAVLDASVHLQACQITVLPAASTSPAGGVGLYGANCNVTAIDCTITGGFGPGLSIPPGDGIVLDNATLHGSGLVIRSGTVLFPPSTNAAYALRGSGALFLSDSQLIGGCPIDWGGTASELSRCTLTGTNTNCPTVAPSPATQLGIARSGPLTPGATFTLTFRGEPNAFVAIFAAASLGRVDLPGLLAQPSWLDSTQSFLMSIVLADAQGVATASWLIPAGPGVADQQVWWKGLSGFTLPFQVSPPAGGITR